MNWQTFGQRLRTLRTQEGKRLVDVAEATGTTFQYVSQLEKGQSGATVETLEALARALGGELILDIRVDAPTDPLIERIEAALPRMPRPALRALLAQIEAFDALAGDGIEQE